MEVNGSFSTKISLVSYSSLLTVLPVSSASSSSKIFGISNNLVNTSISREREVRHRLGSESDVNRLKTQIDFGQSWLILSKVG